jgi:protein-tyrosine phosphatase
MADEFTVLAVCTGNVHRSALAHDLLESWAARYLPAALISRVRVVSAGTRAVVGEPTGGIVQRVATSLGADDRQHRAALLTDPLIAQADLVLTASAAHRHEVVGRVPRAMRRTFTILEAGRIAATLETGEPRSVDDLRAVTAELADLRVEFSGRGENDDIIDPQGLDEAAYDAMVADEVPALVRIAVALWGMPAAHAEAVLQAVADPGALRGA